MNGNGEPIPFDRATILGPDGKAEVPHITAEMCLANAANGTAPDQIIAMALVGILHQSEKQAARAEAAREEQTKIAEALEPYLRPPPPGFEPPPQAGPESVE